MKTKFLFLAFFMAAFFAAHAQQVPNGGFDSWTASPYAPDNWSTYELAFGFSLGLAEKDTVDKIAGTASLSLFSDSIPGQPQLGVLSGIASLGTITAIAGPPSFYGIPFTYRPDTIFFGFKYVPVGSDSAALVLGIKSNGAYMLATTQGPASVALTANPNWVLAGAPITGLYLNANTPDTLEIQFYSSLPTLTHVARKGSNLHVDGVLFGYINLPTALQEVADRLNISVYPNPANDVITISTNDNAEGFRAIITDMNGKMVAANYLGAQKTQVSVADLSSGTYIYRVADKKGNILKQDRFNVVK